MPTAIRVSGPLGSSRAALSASRRWHADGGDALDEQVLVDLVDVGLGLAEDEDGRRRLLEALEQVEHLRLLLDVLDLLDHVQVGGSRPADVDDHRLDERLRAARARSDECRRSQKRAWRPGERRAGEGLDLGGHSCREEEGLPLPGEEVEDLAHLLLEGGLACRAAVRDVSPDVPVQEAIYTYVYILCRGEALTDESIRLVERQVAAHVEREAPRVRVRVRVRRSAR